jgi:hypothetical protein
MQSLRYLNGRKYLSPLSEEDKRTLWYKKPVGRVTCPCCKMAMVLVCNPKGEEGNDVNDYLVTHLNALTKSDCSMSKKTYFDALDKCAK